MKCQQQAEASQTSGHLGNNILKIIINLPEQRHVLTRSLARTIVKQQPEITPNGLWKTLRYPGKSATMPNDIQQEISMLKELWEEIEKLRNLKTTQTTKTKNVFFKVSCLDLVSILIPSLLLIFDWFLYVQISSKP